MKHWQRRRGAGRTVHTLVNRSLTALACAAVAICAVDCSVAHITSGSSGAAGNGPGGSTTSSVASSGAGGDAAGGHGGAVGGAAPTYAEIVMADDPIAYWRFEQVSPGGIAEDETGSFDGTYVGAPVAAPSLVANGAAGLGTQALEDGVDVGPWLPFEGAEESYSVEVWIQPLQTVDQNRRIVTNVDCCNNGWSMYLLSGTIRFGRGDSTPTSFVVSSDLATPISNAEPTHVVGVHDATNDQLCVWLNGALSACTNGVLQYDQDSVNLGFAASNDPMHQFQGVLDELAIYDKALTPEQITAHHQAGL